MHNGNSPTALRRSSRVPTALQIQVTSLAGTYFSDVCKTLVVNAHGCAVLSPVKFDAGIPLRFKNRDGRESTAKENDRGVNWPAASSSRCGQGDSGATRSESQPL